MLLYILTLRISVAVRKTKDSELNGSKRTLNVLRVISGYNFDLLVTAHSCRVSLDFFHNELIYKYIVSMLTENHKEE